jgi:hypothetical protein
MVAQVLDKKVVDTPLIPLRFSLLVRLMLMISLALFTIFNTRKLRVLLLFRVPP